MSSCSVIRGRESRHWPGTWHSFSLVRSPWVIRWSRSPAGCPWSWSCGSTRRPDGGTVRSRSSYGTCTAPRAWRRLSRSPIESNYLHQDELLATFKEYLREQYELPVAQAVTAARTMVKQLRERNFILGHYGAGTYAFVHRTFLEYLAAEDIGRRYTREREWTPEELIDEVFVRRG